MNYLVATVSQQYHKLGRESLFIVCETVKKTIRSDMSKLLQIDIWEQAIRILRDNGRLDQVRSKSSNSYGGDINKVTWNIFHEWKKGSKSRTCKVCSQNMENIVFGQVK